MNFSSNLKRLLEDRGISQKQFAKDLNMAPSTIGNYIQNTREPDFKTLVEISNYFNVSVDDLLGGGFNTVSEEKKKQALEIYGSMSCDSRKLWIEIGKAILNQECRKRMEKM